MKEMMQDSYDEFWENPGEYITSEQEDIFDGMGGMEVYVDPSRNYTYTTTEMLGIRSNTLMKWDDYYSWGISNNLVTHGYHMNALASPDDKQTKENKEFMEKMIDKYSKYCKKWKVDETLFTVPNDIDFLNLENIVADTANSWTSWEVPSLDDLEWFMDMAGLDESMSEEDREQLQKMMEQYSQ